MMHDAVKEALAVFEGNQSRLAEAIGTNQQRISYILARQNPLPAELVLAAERETGIPRHRFRPDVYPAPVGTTAAAA